MGLGSRSSVGVTTNRHLVTDTSQDSLAAAVRLNSVLPLVGAGSHTQDSGILTGLSLSSAPRLPTREASLMTSTQGTRITYNQPKRSETNNTVKPQKCLKEGNLRRTSEV